jgi:hypothetical protein
MNKQTRQIQDARNRYQPSPELLQRIAQRGSQWKELVDGFNRGEISNTSVYDNIFGAPVPNPLPFGQLVVTAEQFTRYVAHVNIQDYYGQPYRVSFVSLEVLPGGRDEDSPENHKLVERLAKESLKQYARLMRGKGGLRSIPIHWRK